MASKALASLALLVTLNLLLFTSVTSKCLGTCPQSCNVVALQACLAPYVQDNVLDTFPTPCLLLIDGFLDVDAAACVCIAVKLFTPVVTVNLEVVMKQCYPNYGCNDQCPP